MSKVHTLHLLLLLASFMFLPSPVFADRTQAIAALNQGRADDAEKLLRTQLTEDPHQPSTHLLLCRVFYSEELTDPAIQQCEAAVAESIKAGDASSDSYLWLGRAYGLKASRANPISAFRLARRVASSFERAVALDPANAAALSDLGEFYVAAPSVVGGGLDKAQQLSTKIMPVSATKAHRILGLIAEKKGDSITAEAEYKRAIEADRCPDTYVDLGAFYQRHKRNDESVATLQQAIRLDTVKDAALVDAASILTDANRSLQLAEQLLRSYLASSAKSDSQPAARVHVQLGNLLVKKGDSAAGQREYQAALALASRFEPARKALQTLPASPSDPTSGPRER